MSKVKDQKVTEEYAIYNGDCMDVISQLPDNSIDLSIFSPPFMDLYQYSSDPRDFSNVASNDEGMTQYEFLVKELSRVVKSGRIVAVHCQDMPNKKGEYWDYPSEIIRLHKKYGFKYMNRITVWKEPLKVRIRTMVKSLMHKTLCEDSTNTFTAMPDYILIFKKNGENEVPVKHENGVTYYAGQTPITEFLREGFNKKNGTDYSSEDIFNYLKDKYEDYEGDHKLNLLSHHIFRRYMSSVWDDIRPNNVLNFKDAREEDDEKHVHALQLDIIHRIIQLYSNPNEKVFTPFMGVGSEVYGAVSMGRKGIGVELKDSYYKQAIRNLKSVKLIEEKRQTEIKF